MPTLGKASIRLKRWSLAGVPVVGALLLAAMIVGDARQQAARAAAIGSIEDLAQLSSIMAQPLLALQKERAWTALVEGLEVRPPDARDAEAARGAARPFQRAVALARASGQLETARAATDQSLAHLDAFPAERDLSRLPPRLARDLADARAHVAELGPFRSGVDAKAVPLDSVLKVFGGINVSLIRANAGLSELSDEGELLRRIQSIVAVHGHDGLRAGVRAAARVHPGVRARGGGPARPARVRQRHEQARRRGELAAARRPRGDRDGARQGDDLPFPVPPGARRGRRLAAVRAAAAVEPARRAPAGPSRGGSTPGPSTSASHPDRVTP